MQIRLIVLKQKITKQKQVDDLLSRPVAAAAVSHQRSLGNVTEATCNRRQGYYSAAAAETSIDSVDLMGGMV